MLGAILGSVLGSVVTGLFNKSSANDQMDFQENMSNTSYQRAVKDMEAAGINPMLASKMGGATTPPGASATMPDLGQTLSSATQASRVNAEIDKIKADTKVAESQERLNDVIAIKNEVETRLGVANATKAEMENAKEQYLRSEWGKLGVEGAELAERQAKAVYETAMTNRNYNIKAELDELAIKQGYNTFDAAIQHQSFRDALQDYAIKKLQIPREEALSEFFKSEWGKEIAPYLNSANDVTGILGAVTNMFKKRGSINIIPKGN